MRLAISRTSLLAVLALIVLVSPVRAQDLTIAAFFGTFKGGGVAENRDSIYFGITVRDFDVSIRPAGNGFSVEWATIIRKGGDPNNPDVRRKAQTATFVPTGQPGVYRATDLADPLSGGRYTWARLEGSTLMVYIMTIDAKGRYSVQSYARTLHPSGMDFVFQRIRDGDELRTVKGKLIKYAQ